MKRIYIFFVFSCCFNNIFAQFNQANVWYFGNGNGIDFNTNPPKKITNGIFHRGRITTLCDDKGKLLFYTDGMTVIDKNHNIMKNGKGLFGQAETIMVTCPKKKGVYYIFAVSMNPDMKSYFQTKSITFEEEMKTLKVLTEQELNELHKKEFIVNQKNAYLYYNIIDMNKNEGLGEVIEKNKYVYAKIKADLLVARHANNTDYWLITHEFLSNKFKIFLINEQGLQKPAFETQEGMQLTSNQNLDVFHHLNNNINGSQMAISSNFDKIALYDFEQSNIQVFDFDNETANIKLSNTFPIIQDLNTTTRIFSIDFSPDGTKLYATSNISGVNKVISQGFYQYNISKNGELKQKVFLFEKEDRRVDKNNPKSFLNPFISGDIRVGADGKMYFSQWLKNIGVIENPNDDLDNLRIKYDFYTFEPKILSTIQKHIHLLPPFYPPIKSGDTFQREILFETNKYELKEHHYPILGDIVKFLKENPKTNITVSGHTDNEGNPQVNKILSENRAKSVKNYLISQKINPNRITSQGFGDTKPLLDNSTPENKRKNRRIEFLIQ